MRQGLRRRLATGTNAAIVVVAVVLVSLLLVDLASRFRLRIDLSSDRVASLKGDTLDVLERLDASGQTATVTAFSPRWNKPKEGMYRERMMRDLLRALERNTSNLEVEWVDFDSDRKRTLELNVKAYGSVVIQVGDQRVDLKDRELFRRRQGSEIPAFHGEDAVSRALSEAMSSEPTTIYLTKGHGERGRDPGDNRGLAALISAWERQGWSVRELDLLRELDEGPPEVPADASAVYVVAPDVALAEPEVDALESYLRRGGSLGFFVEPASEVPELVEDLGVTRPEGWVRDPAAWLYPNEDWPLLTAARHPVVEDLAGIATVAAYAAGLEVSERAGVGSSRLLTTTRRGWVERGSEKPAVFDETVDGQGPVTVALALEIDGSSQRVRENRRARVLVVGDADVLSSEFIEKGPGNETFAVNTARWLLRLDDRIGAVGTPKRIRTIQLLPGQEAAIRWIVMGLVPMSVMLLGCGIWLLRRGR